MKEIVVAAMSTIGGDILQGVWDESDYIINMWRVTKGAHIELL
jgi:hypothetical protein